MAITEIPWTQAVWNPVKGCRRVSPGCGGGEKGPDGEQGGCYAEAMAARLVRMGGYEWIDDAWCEDPTKKWTAASRANADKYKPLVRIGRDGKARWTGVFLFDEEKLDEPLRRHAPTLYFANSMSDLFGEGLTNEQIAAVFGVMAACPQHTFQVLTKRAARMVEWFEWLIQQSSQARTGVAFAIHHAMKSRLRYRRNTSGAGVSAHVPWPLPNVWLGVSCERQQEADERVPLLLQCPAAVRWVSAEPLLGPIQFRMIGSNGQRAYDALTGHMRHDDGTPISTVAGPHLDWLVPGGESGHGARPCHVSWIRTIVEDCRATGVPVFPKQLGAYAMDFHLDMASEFGEDSSGHYRARLKDKKGANPEEWPEDLRGRAWPHGFTPPKDRTLPLLA